MHGDKSQAQRERALARFESGQVDTLVATDVAARGIDVAGITHVINYDMPASREDYVHRVGRTARAGASGTGVTFVADDQTHELVGMARDLGLHQALELGGFPSDATRGGEQRGARPAQSRSRSRGRVCSRRGADDVRDVPRMIRLGAAPHADDARANPRCACGEGRRLSVAALSDVAPTRCAKLWRSDELAGLHPRTRPGPGARHRRRGGFRRGRFARRARRRRRSRSRCCCIWTGSSRA